MKWWQIRKRDADLERELRSDIELEEEEQREDGLSPESARFAARRVKPGGGRRSKESLKICGTPFGK